MSPRAFLSVSLLVLLAIGGTRQLVARPAAVALVISALRQGQPPQQTGSFPDRWISGIDCQSEADFQVHAYNEDLYIIRQTKCGNHEGPFLFLIFGESEALLMDTGSSVSLDVYGTVRRVLHQWADAHQVAVPPLIVAHTHSHIDHVRGDSQFEGQPEVLTMVPKTLAGVQQFFGFQDWPNDVGQIDLGNRVLDVLATPGHQGHSITLYDRRTHLMFSGDIVYPGHLFVFTPQDWSVLKDSLRRMIRFAREYPVEWVVGCHIETSTQPFQPYAWGTETHPNEHVLQLPPTKIVEILDAAQGQGANPACEIFDEFVLHPVFFCPFTWNG